MCHLFNGRSFTEFFFFWISHLNEACFYCPPWASSCSFSDLHTSGEHDVFVNGKNGSVQLY